MLKRFLEGLVFGAGFAIALIVIAVGSVSLLLPITFRSAEEPVRSAKPLPIPNAHFERPGLQFHDLPLEEQIRQASVIALARYEPAADGKMKAVIREFLKKEPNATIHYGVGDEYPSASFYPNEGRSHGEGVVIFFVGSPADMRLSVTYDGDRIRGLSDIPLELFKEKCKAPGGMDNATNGT